MKDGEVYFQTIDIGKFRLIASVALSLDGTLWRDSKDGNEVKHLFSICVIQRQRAKMLQIIVLWAHFAFGLIKKKEEDSSAESNKPGERFSILAQDFDFTKHYLVLDGNKHEVIAIYKRDFGQINFSLTFPRKNGKEHYVAGLDILVEVEAIAQ